MNWIVTTLILALLLLTGACLAAPIFSFPARGVASYYGAKFDGRTTASGALFNSREFTCATQSRTVPFGTILKVTNLSNGKVVFVKCSDRMGKNDPKDRIIDLSTAAFAKIEDLRRGVCRVKIEIVEKK